ncbi:membrane protein [Streptococcus suis]|nr:membrane protein [Streptococcus suis]
MQLFNSIFSTANSNITLAQMSMVFGVSLSMGVLLAAVYKYKSNGSVAKF